MKQWSCFRCGGHDIEELVVHGVFRTPVVDVVLTEGIHGEEALIEYGEPSIDDGDHEQFQCAACGRPVPLDEVEALAEALA